MSTVILCGMPDEQHVLRDALPGILVLSGTDKLNLQHLVPPDCNLIVSAGLCGGTTPTLGVGEVVVASTLTDKGGHIDHPDQIWNKKITHAMAVAGIKVTMVPYYSSGLFDEVDSQLQRAEFFKKGFWAIDDESRYVAAFAKQRRISFGILRSISDAWGETLPREATGAIMNTDGSPNLAYLAETLKIQDVPQLLQIAEDFKTSLDALEAAAKACAAVFV